MSILIIRAVFSGMISATLLLIFFVAAFYRLIQRSSEGLGKRFNAGKKAGELPDVTAPVLEHQSN